MSASTLTNEHRTRACRQWQAIAFALIIVTGITAYSNSIHGSFHFDDPHTIAKNPSIRSLNPARIWAGNNRFRFVGFYSFALNYRLNGLDDVRGWHYVNIGIHICCALLFYTVMSLLMHNVNGGGSKIPLAASILFVAHPLCSEPVNYIQARHVLFCSFFSLSGLLCTVLFVKAKSKTGRIICALGIATSIVLGSLSKEVGMFYVPAIIGAYLYAFGVLEGPDRAVFRRISAVGAATAGIVLVMITNWVIPISKIFRLRYDPVTGGEIAYISYLLTQTQIFWRYVSLLVPLSSRLNVDHYVRIVKIETLAQTLTAVIPAFGMGVILAAAFKVRLRNPVWSFLVLWVILGILPHLLIYVSAEHMVEYRAYLSAMGLMGLSALCLSKLTRFARNFHGGSAPLAAAFGSLSPHGGKQILSPIPPDSHRNTNSYAFKLSTLIPIVAFALLVAFCVSETRTRNRIWESEISLWGDAVKKSSGKVRPYNNLGNAYRKIGENEKAMASYKKALEIKPDYLKAINNLGSAYNAVGLHQEAIVLFRKAIGIKPSYAKAYNNLGNAYYGIGENREAILCYAKAIEIEPNLAEPYHNSGAAYLSMGKYREAIPYLNRAVEIKPDYAEAYINLSVVYFREKQYELAIEYCDKAEELGPVNPALLETLKPYRR